MVKYSKAGEGKKWVLTELGGENGRVRAKFEKGNVNAKLYAKTVPSNWVELGYVVEATIKPEEEE